MAQTPAERQAAAQARKARILDDLTATNAALIAKNAELQAELASLKEKLHRSEISALKAKIKSKV